MIRFFVLGFLAVLAFSSSPNAYGCDAGNAKPSAAKETKTSAPTASVPTTTTVASRNVRRAPSAAEKPVTVDEETRVIDETT